MALVPSINLPFSYDVVPQRGFSMAESARPRVEDSRLAKLAPRVASRVSLSSSREEDKSRRAYLRREYTVKRGGMEVPSAPRASSPDASDSDNLESLTVDEIHETPLVDPLICKCGHTFNRATWYGLARQRDRNGEINNNFVLCPSSNQLIRLDRLYPNLHARRTVDCVEKHREKDARKEDIIIQILQGMQKKMEEMQSQGAAEIRNLHVKIDQLRIDTRGAEDRAIAAERQVQNFREMTVCDRLKSILPCYADSVQNRNVSPQNSQAVVHGSRV